MATQVNSYDAIDSKAADLPTKLGDRSPEDMATLLTALPPSELTELWAERGYTMVYPDDFDASKYATLKENVAHSLSAGSTVAEVLASLPHEFAHWTQRNWFKDAGTNVDISGWTAKRSLQIGLSSSTDMYQVDIYPINHQLSYAEGSDKTKYEIVPVYYDSVNEQVIIGTTASIVDLIAFLHVNGMRQYSTELVRARLAGEKAPVPPEWKPLVEGLNWGAQSLTGDEFMDQAIAFPEMCFIAPAVTPTLKASLKDAVGALTKIGSAVVHPDWKVLIVEPSVLGSSEETVKLDRYTVAGRTEDGPYVVRYVDPALLRVISKTDRDSLVMAAVLGSVSGSTSVVSSGYFDLVATDSKKAAQKVLRTIGVVTKHGIVESGIKLTIDRGATTHDVDNGSAVRVEGALPPGVDIGDWVWVEVNSAAGSKKGRAVVEVDDVFKSLVSDPSSLKTLSARSTSVLSVARLLPVAVRARVPYFTSASWSYSSIDLLDDASTQLIGPRSPDEWNRSAYYHGWVSRGQPWRLKRGCIPAMTAPTVASLLFSRSAISTGAKLELMQTFKRGAVAKINVGLRGFDDRAESLVTFHF